MNYSKKYPHKLYRLVVGETTTNDFGQEIVGTSELVLICECYENVLGQSKEVKSSNGEVKIASSKVFLPIVTDIKDGEVIEVRGISDELRLKGEVKRNSKEDKQGSRLWV